MSATTPEIRGAAPVGGVAIGKSVRSAHWLEAIRLQNWCAGRGWKVVPAHNPFAEVEASGSGTFTYRVLPRFQDIRYALTLVLSAAAESEVTVTVDGTDYVYRTRTSGFAEPRTFFWDVSSQSATETDISFTVAAGTEDVTVHSVLIEAVPRALLSTTNNDLGAEPFDFWPRSPIYTGNLADQIINGQNELRDACRRGQFHNGWGSAAPWSMASASWTDVFGGGGFPLLGRYIYNGDTVRTLNWRVRAYCSDGTTSASVRVTMTSGDTDTISIPTSSTSAAWFPATSGSANTFDVDAEDNTTSDGRRSSRWDMASIDVQRTAGAGTVYLETISIWEP